VTKSYEFDRNEGEFEYYLELSHSKGNGVTEILAFKCTGIVKPIVTTVNGDNDDDDDGKCVSQVVTDDGEHVLQPGPIGMSCRDGFSFEDIHNVKEIRQISDSRSDCDLVCERGCASISENSVALCIEKQNLVFNRKGKFYSVHHEKGFCRLFKEGQGSTNFVFVDTYGDAFYVKRNCESESYEKIPFLPGFTKIENVCFCDSFCLVLTKTGRLYLSNFTMSRQNENFEGYVVVQNLKTTLKHLDNRRSCIYLQDVTQTVLEPYSSFPVDTGTVVPRIVNMVPGIDTFYVSLSSGETMGYSFQSIRDDMVHDANDDHLDGLNSSGDTFGENFRGINRFLTFSGKITGSTSIGLYGSNFLALIIDYSSLYILSLDDLESTPCPNFPLRFCDSYQLEGITKDLCCIIKEGPQHANMVVIFLLKSTGQITSVSFTDILRISCEKLVPELNWGDEFFLLGATSGETHVGSFSACQPEIKRCRC